MTPDLGKRRGFSRKTSPTPLNFRIGAIAAGDIVFVYDQSTRLRKRFVRLINVIGQRILVLVRKKGRLTPTQWVRSYSHVMLGVGGGLIIHADGKTVAVEIISDALHYPTNEASLFQVYRRKDMSPDVAKKIVKSAMSYFSQKYRFSSFFIESVEDDTTQFCSRLAAYAYRAADLPLTSLSDRKVLPVDLYRICQSDAWREITADFVEQPPDPRAGELLPPVEIPGRSAMSMPDFLEYGDALIFESARLSKEFIKLQHETTQKVLENEGLLSKFSALQFDVAKQVRLSPGRLEDTVALSIARVLAQMDSLLALSRLPDIELLIGNSLLNADAEEKDAGLYVGYPKPLAIREMQKARSAVTIYTYLLFAEIGLSVTLAHRTPYEKFNEFRSTSAKYADQFITALEPVDDLSPYENGETLFDWVEGEDDRARCREIFRNIVAALKVIKIMRDAASRRD